MLALGEIDNNQYGVGFPIDMPVTLTYFEGNELKPVKEDFPDYDHLINHVSVQLENNDLYLYQTPVVLTLQGEFEDENMNEIYTPTNPQNSQHNLSKRKIYGELEEFRNLESTLDDDYNDNNQNDDHDDNDDDHEISIEEIIAMEGLDKDDEFDDDEDDEDFPEDSGDTIDESDQNKEESNRSFWNSSPSGKNDEQSSIPDISIYRPKTPDLRDVPEDAFVTEEDTKSLRRAHRKADKIIKYAADVKLIASFHYKKNNFHLVKLLEVNSLHVQIYVYF
jgi:hypothetical protein